ncbi:DUF4129 domain-containing protein [Actinotalea sp. BY-33]|uniref:DUF4129 domain-containing protein n=1 Tax=Actinotalea soli TaxID=2819234 RepID=A0A939RVE7_9CELL|nr:DUF4129 domain-containing protein [Actinotalea soli]MBO1751061.1 DUF4129 domain-containing protein [Actinotalea soli]
MGRTTRAGTEGPRGPDPVGEPPPVRSRPDGPPPRGVAAVLLVGVAVVAGALAGPWELTFRSRGAPVEQPLPEAVQPPVPSPTADPFLRELERLDVEPWDLRWLAGVVLTLVFLGVAFLVLQWWRRRLPGRSEPGPPDPADVAALGVVAVGSDAEPDLPALRDGVAGAGARLRVLQNPGDAVIAAWVALEEAAARSGVPRAPSSTPTEFTVTVLDRTAVDPGATRALLALYLRARFGGQRLGPEDVAAATAAITTLGAGLEGDA